MSSTYSLLPTRISDFKQNLAAIDLAVIVLPSNQVPVVKLLLPAIDEALETIQPGSLIEIPLP